MGKVWAKIKRSNANLLYIFPDSILPSNIPSKALWIFSFNESQQHSGISLK